MPVNLVTWNIGGVPHGVSSTPFSAVEPYLAGLDADIVCLQEIFDVDAKFDAAWGSAYTVIGPSNVTPTNKNVRNAVIATTERFEDGGHFGFDDVGYSTGSVSWATLLIEGMRFRVYSARLEVSQIGMRGRLDMMRKVVRHADHGPDKVIIAGDMNTTIPRSGLGRALVKLVHRTSQDKQVIGGVHRTCDERHVFNGFVGSHGFNAAAKLHRDTWAIPGTSIEYPSLKLDWVVSRGIDAAVERFGPYISDHRPIHVSFNPM